MGQGLPVNQLLEELSMQLKHLNYRMPFCVVLLCLTACALPPKRPCPQELVTPLNKLMPAVQSVFMWPDDEGTPLSDEKVLEQVLKDDPTLAAAFAHAHVQIRHDQANVVIMVCAPEDDRAWLEDASWTPGVDIKWFEKDPSRPCGFLLDPTQAPHAEAPMQQ